MRPSWVVRTYVVLLVRMAGCSAGALAARRKPRSRPFSLLVPVPRRSGPVLNAIAGRRYYKFDSQTRIYWKIALIRMPCAYQHDAITEDTRTKLRYSQTRRYPAIASCSMRACILGLM